MARKMINGCLYIDGDDLEEWEQDEVYSSIASGNMQIASKRPPDQVKKPRSK